MQYLYCNTHKIHYNQILAPRCPICVFGKSKDIEDNITTKKTYKELSQKLSIPRIICKTQDIDKFLATLDKKYLSKSKEKEIVAYRRGVIKVLRKQFLLSYPKIAKILGFHHTTIMHYFKNEEPLQNSEKNDQGK